MDPIVTGGLVAAAVWSVYYGAKHHIPANFTYLAVDGDTVTVKGGGK